MGVLPFFKNNFFSHITVAVIYLCLRAWLGLLWSSGRRSHYSGGSRDRWREESQTKHESEGVSQSACEHPGGLWESASLEKCPRGGNWQTPGKQSVPSSQEVWWEPGHVTLSSSSQSHWNGVAAHRQLGQETEGSEAPWPSASVKSFIWLIEVTFSVSWPETDLVFVAASQTWSLNFLFSVCSLPSLRSVRVRRASFPDC